MKTTTMSGAFDRSLRFVLIHGGLHGAWCWEQLERELRARGHDTVAMDLPVDEAERTLDDYADVVAAATPPGRAILVGHSLGGFVAPRVALRRADLRIAMLCAGFPPTTAEEQAELRITVDPDNFPGMERDAKDRISAPVNTAVAAFYGGVAPAEAEAAARRLRPQWIGAFTDIAAIAPYTHLMAGVIACREDPVAPQAQQQERSRRLFGIEPLVLPGGHSPFLACPQLLADALVHVGHNPTNDWL